MEEKISDKDLHKISNAKHKVELAVLTAQKATLEAKLADVEFRSLVQQIFIEYNLGEADRIDDATGQITRMVKEEDIEMTEEEESE